MVEANEAQIEQPQEKQTPGASDATTRMIESMELKFSENSVVLSERVDILKQLKEEQSLLSLKFAKFNAEQIGKLKSGSMFARGLPFYTDLQTQVIQELEKDIARHEKALQDQRA